jgi:hypothetical protein
MDHADAQELLETAAAEPGGLDRLMAGDTVEAAALAGHLAGCAECTADVGRLRRDAAVIRDAVRSLPPEGLRERTLAYVAALGRERGAGAEATPASPPTAVTPAQPAPSSRPEASAGRGEAGPVSARRATVPSRWLAAIAAVLIAAVAGTALIVDARRDAEIAARDAELAERNAAVAVLERIASAGLRVASEPDAQHVSLTGAGGEASGSLLFSPGTRELVVLATGLDEPADEREFRCWVEIDGERRPVGRMFFADELAFWAGPVEAVADLPDGARFGVTLVDSAGSSLDGDPALSGGL